MNTVFIIALVLAIGIANLARIRYEAVRLGRKRPAPEKLTGGEIAREFLDASDASDIRIVEHDGFISDYFDPKRRCLFLSPEVLKSRSEAAWATALHEAAHALQLRSMSTSLDMRMSNIKLTRYVPMLAALLVIVLGFLRRPPIPIGWKILAIILFIVMLLNVMSLPIEFHASRLAIAFLERRLQRHPEALESLQQQLKAMAWRDTAVFLQSPRYCFSALLPVGGRLRPK